MLDRIGDARTLGKAVGVDGKKNTFVRLYGMEVCETLVAQHTHAALDGTPAVPGREVAGAAGGFPDEPPVLTHGRG